MLCNVSGLTLSFAYALDGFAPSNQVLALRFTAQTGLTWDQGIEQQPQDVQAVLAASWQ
jgi:hypothetical protein